MKFRAFGRLLPSSLALSRTNSSSTLVYPESAFSILIQTTYSLFITLLFFQPHEAVMVNID